MAVSAANSHLVYREFHLREQQQPPNSSLCNSISVFGGFGVSSLIGKKEVRARRRCEAPKVGAFWPGVSRPTSIEMEAITGMEELDEALARAKERSQHVIIEWMANWCRKCIYLKPKLEKLAAEYEDKIKFYCVDVNNVPQALVKRGNISKMPTIQAHGTARSRTGLFGEEARRGGEDEINKSLDQHEKRHLDQDTLHA